MKIKFVSIALLFLIINYSTMAQPVAVHGQLHVDGIQLKDKNNHAVVLRGMSFGWHNWWPRFYNADVVKWLHEDWNCSVVRAAMGVEPDGAYLDRPDWSKEKIKAVIDGAIEEGIYVVIDWHSHNIRLEEAKKFFTEMAKEYGKYPNVIYEIFNEPERQAWQEVKAYSIELIKTIRAIDANNIILVGNPHWDQDIDIVADDPVTGFSNIMYTVHFYAATHKQSLRHKCDYALGKKIPIFISESAGMEATGDGQVDDAEWNKWITWAEANKISWITWSIADKNETCSVVLPSASSNGHWGEKDLKESGIKARQLLRKYAGNNK
ncbi:MAG: glycoside hydrolase family 5 protein [Bacteroidota bacterium]|nr:glycoside hydrolase family 5 protein [Bacteroidota bacterium]